MSRMQISQNKKNGIRKGVQTYKCCECGYQFRNERLPPTDEIWRQYQSNKQTISELAEQYRTSESTIKRRLKDESEQPQRHVLGESGPIHQWFFLGIGVIPHEKKCAAVFWPPIMRIILWPYSSQSCSPAELCYASDRGAKVRNLFRSSSLQFDL